MIYLLVLIGIGIMGFMVYLALNKKSNFAVRIASLVAIGIMLLAIIICLIIIFTDNRVPVDPSALIVGAPPETNPDAGGNFWVVLLLIVFLIGMFTFIAIHSMKENRKHAQSLSESKKEITRSFDF